MKRGFASKSATCFARLPRSQKEMPKGEFRPLRRATNAPRRWIRAAFLKGERGDRRRGRIKGAERVAGVAEAEHLCDG